jgi:hypothetical protein
MRQPVPTEVKLSWDAGGACAPAWLKPSTNNTKTTSALRHKLRYNVH